MPLWGEKVLSVLAFSAVRFQLSAKAWRLAAEERWPQIGDGEYPFCRAKRSCAGRSGSNAFEGNLRNAGDSFVTRIAPLFSVSASAMMHLLKRSIVISKFPLSKLTDLDRLQKQGVPRLLAYCGL